MSSLLVYLPNAGIMVDASRMSRRKREGIGEILVEKKKKKIQASKRDAITIIECDLIFIVRSNNLYRFRYFCPAELGLEQKVKKTS